MWPSIRRGQFRIGPSMNADEHACRRCWRDHGCATSARCFRVPNARRATALKFSQAGLASTVTRRSNTSAKMTAPRQVSSLGTSLKSWSTLSSRNRKQAYAVGNGRRMRKSASAAQSNTSCLSRRLAVIWPLSGMAAPVRCCTALLRDCRSAGDTISHRQMEETGLPSTAIAKS